MGDVVDIRAQLELAKKLDKDLTKKYGDRYRGGLVGKTLLEPCEFLPSGIYTLDRIIGGGIPLGKVIEMYSGESCGKTTILLHLIAQMQEYGHLCAFVDFERTLDTRQMARIGVRDDMLAIFEPDHAEDGINFIIDLLRSGAITGIIGIDSIAAMKSKDRMEKAAEENTMAAEARLLSANMPQIVKLANKCRAPVVALNQIRKNLGAYGNPDSPAGGMAMKFYASVRLQLKRKKDGDPKSPPGIHIEVVNIKNKVSTPYRTGELDILFPHVDAEGVERAGVDKVLDLVTAATEREVLKKNGAFYTLPDGTKLQGLAKVREHYASDTDELDNLYQLLQHDQSQEDSSDSTSNGGGLEEDDDGGASEYAGAA